MNEISPLHQCVTPGPNQIQPTVDVKQLIHYQLHRSMCITCLFSWQFAHSNFTITGDVGMQDARNCLQKCCASMRIPESPALKFRAVTSAAELHKCE